MTAQVDFSQTSGFLKRVIEENVLDQELEWINEQEDKLRADFQLRTFYLAFSSASRHIRKKALPLSMEQMNEAEAIRKGFHPQSWNLLQWVRTYFVLMLPHQDVNSYESHLTRLHETADIDEQVTLYAALPILPHPVVNSKRAAEGIRTNITDVFDAIALDNPYPADFLSQQAWNQMVLKAVFMQRPLYRIYGADSRANPELAGMLIDFAHERWAANRKVIPELWRFVGPYLSIDSLTDIEKVIKGDSLEMQAALLACASSSLPAARQVLDRYPEIKKDIESTSLSWIRIGENFRQELKN